MGPLSDLFASASDLLTGAGDIASGDISGVADQATEAVTGGIAGVGETVQASAEDITAAIPGEFDNQLVDGAADAFNNLF